MKKFCSYSYNSVDGSVTCIEAGENGVTEAHIKLIMELDENEKSEERYRNEFMEVPFDEYIEHMMSRKNGNTKDEKEPKQKCMEKLLRQCVDRLNPEQQELYYAVMGLRRTYEEIATNSGVTRQAIYSQMNTIKRKLRKMLEELQ